MEDYYYPLTSDNIVDVLENIAQICKEDRYIAHLYAEALNPVIESLRYSDAFGSCNEFDPRYAYFETPFFNESKIS